MVDLLVTLHFSACRWGPREICVRDFEVVLYDVQMKVSSRHWGWSTGWNTQWGWGRGYGLRSCHQAVRQGEPAPIAGTSGVLSAEERLTAAVTGPTPGPEEVIMKKAALVTVQKQMAALVRGEDLLASQPGAREVQDVPYVVLVVGGEGTKCPICHLVFTTPYQLREHMDVHRGEAIPLWQLFKAVGQPLHVKGSPERLHLGVQVHLWGVWLWVCDKARIETAYKGHPWSWTACTRWGLCLSFLCKMVWGQEVNERACHYL